MADFLTTKGISHQLDQIIKKSEKTLYILSPYLRLSPTIYESIIDAIRRNVNVNIIYGKSEITSDQDKLLKKLNCNVFFKENLHGKCYANETTAIITSMNLHTFSEVNNREFGVLINKRTDSIAFNDCITEIESIINQASTIATIERREQEQVKVEFDNNSFQDGWRKYLIQRFPKTRFKLEQKGDRIEFSAKDFPFPRMNFSNKYGFITIELKETKGRLDIARENMLSDFYSKFVNYRFYWKSDHRIMIYFEKDASFNSLEENISYCSKALDILLEEFKRLN